MINKLFFNFFSKLQLLTRREKGIFCFFVFINFILNFLELIGLGILIPIMKSIINNENIISFSLNSFKFNFDVKLAILFLIFIFGFKSISLTMVRYYLLRFLKKVEMRLNKTLFDSYLSMDWSTYLTQKNSTYIRNIFNNVPEYISKVVISTNLLIVEYLWLVTVYLFFLLINLKLALIVSLIAIILLIIYKFAFKVKFLKLGKVRQKLISEIFNSINQIFSNFKSIKLDEKELFFLKRFDQIYQPFINVNYKQKFYETLPRIWLEFFFAILMLFTLLFLAHYSYDISDLIPIIAFIVIISLKTIPALSKIMILNQYISFFQKSYENLIYQFKRSIQKRTNSKLSKFTPKKNKISFKKYIRFKNVNFNFGNKEIIKNKNFKIKKNSINLIIGASGSGKTTLCNMLLGLLSPSKGKIYVDNYDLELNKSFWFDKSSYVPQDVVLLNTNIIQNIAFGEELEKVDFKKLNNAIKQSGLSRFIKQQKNKEFTNILDNAINISGGEKKRIAIARALYKDSQLIIFDEPTNGLDDKNARIIANTVLKLKKIATIIIITHTKHHFQEYDQLIKLEKKYRK